MKNGRVRIPMQLFFFVIIFAEAGKKARPNLGGALDLRDLNFCKLYRSQVGRQPTHAQTYGYLKTSC